MTESVESWSHVLKNHGLMTEPDVVTCTEEILIGKLRFLCSVNLISKQLFTNLISK